MARGEQNIVFYVDDGRIAGRKPIWVQTMLTAVVRMFGRVELQTSLGNNNTMVYNKVFIWGELGVAAYKQRVMGEGGMFR